MSTVPQHTSNRRILVIDDNRSIHEDFRKILGSRPPSALSAAAAELFGDDGCGSSPPMPAFELDAAYQGQEGLERVRASLAQGCPYAMAFVDVRMPPGWDGIETIERIWEIDHDLQTVICTAYSDYPWEGMVRRLRHSDRLLILKKPFDNIEALQLATALTEKWNLLKQVRRHVNELADQVGARTMELLASESRYRLIAENAADLIAIVDSDGRLSYQSPSFSRVLGHPHAGLSGTSALDLIHADDRNGFAAMAAACIQRSEEQVREFRARHADGNWRWLEAHSGPFRNASSAVEGMLLVARDVTERRTLELQLRQSQKLESIGQLAAGIAHEINTPTQFIGDNARFLGGAFSSFSRLCDAYRRVVAAAEAGRIAPELVGAARNLEIETEADYLLEAVPGAIAQMFEGIERTSRIVRAMKDFSHPGKAGREPVDLNHVVETTIAASRHEWRYVASVVTDLDPALPRVPADEGELKQVLLNLIINAAHAVADVCKAGHGANGTITVGTRHAGPVAELYVRDTGTGIPEKVRERIFDPFFTTKPVGKGTRQGLAIARSVVVDKHHGTLTCETTVGTGTTFFVRLPLSPEAAAIILPVHAA